MWRAPEWGETSSRDKPGERILGQSSSSSESASEWKGTSSSDGLLAGPCWIRAYLVPLGLGVGQGGSSSAPKGCLEDLGKEKTGEERPAGEERPTGEEATQREVYRPLRKRG